jgi:hypothetical protein
MKPSFSLEKTNIKNIEIVNDKNTRVYSQISSDSIFEEMKSRPQERIF